MLTLATVAGIYALVGLVVGLLVLVRVRAHQFYMLEGLSPMAAVAAAVISWPLVLIEEWRLGRMYRHLTEEPIRTDRVVTEFKIPESWVQATVARRPKDFDWKATSLSPECNPGVEELLKMMVIGDELKKFSSNSAAWQRLGGRAGYVLLRKGQQVAHVTTVMN